MKISRNNREYSWRHSPLMLRLGYLWVDGESSKFVRGLGLNKSLLICCIALKGERLGVRGANDVFVFSVVNTYPTSNDRVIIEKRCEWTTFQYRSSSSSVIRVKHVTENSREIFCRSRGSASQWSLNNLFQNRSQIIMFWNLQFNWRMLKWFCFGRFLHSIPENYEPILQKIASSIMGRIAWNSNWLCRIFLSKKGLRIHIWSISFRSHEESATPLHGVMLRFSITFRTKGVSVI